MNLRVIRPETHLSTLAKERFCLRRHLWVQFGQTPVETTHAGRELFCLQLGIHQFPGVTSDHRMFPKDAPTVVLQVECVIREDRCVDLPFEIAFSRTSDHRPFLSAYATDSHVSPRFRLED